MPKFECEGWFDATVVGQSVERNQKTGNACIKLTVEVQPAGGREPEHAFWTGWFTTKAIEKTLQRLRDSFGHEGGIAGLATANFVGQPVRIKTEAETYVDQKTGKEETVYKVGIITAPGGGSDAFGYHPPDPALIADIARELGHDAPPAPGPAPAEPTAPGNAADDLPF